jgi:hypothetical protein
MLMLMINRISNLLEEVTLIQTAAFADVALKNPFPAIECSGRWFW